MSSSPIIVVVKYRVQPGQEELAMGELRALVATVLSLEPDCQGITILQHSTELTAIMLIEQWTDQATFLGPHMQQPHIQGFIQRAGDFLAGPPDISFWHSIPSV